MNTRPTLAGLVFSFIVFSIFVGLVVIVPTSASAQWKPILTSPYNGISVDEFSFIYFLNQVGHPEIGFTGGEGGTKDGNDTGFLFRTSDGGEIWTQSSFTPADFWDSGGKQWNSCWWFGDMIFKDSLTGWMVAIDGDSVGGCFKTTDGGLTWTFLHQSGTQLIGNNPGSVSYDSITDGLFTLGENWQLVSWDEGNTWSKSVPTGEIIYGYAFANDSEGILHDTYRTTDGGVTWSYFGTCDSDFMQQVAISGTRTYLAVTWYGNVIRTDDMWNTWRIVSQIPSVNFLNSSVVRTTGCIRGTAKYLVAQSALGCFISRDTGTTWKSLCGPSENYLSWAGGGTQRFWVAGSRIYVQTVNIEPSIVDQIWMLDLDSMQYFNSTIVGQFADSAKFLSVKPGTGVTVSYIPTIDAMVGVDSVHFAIRYDSASLVLSNLVIPPGWSILDSSSRNGLLDLLITDTSAVRLPTPVLQLTFKTFLASSSAKVYLDSANLYGQRQNCDCAALSLSPADSVEINFTGCGDSTLLALMNHAAPFSIESIQPNPAQNEITVKLSCAAQPTVEMYDALGREVLAQGTTPQPPPSLGGGVRGGANAGVGAGVRLDVSSVPSGSYILRVSDGEYVQSRRVVIQH